MGLLVGQKAPEFKGTAVVGGNADALTPDNAFAQISSEDYKGKWVVLFFYPLDFTFVCPTEIEDFGRNYEKIPGIEHRSSGLLDRQPVLAPGMAPAVAGTENLPFPMLADFTGETSKNFEIFKEETGYALRGLYLIDPDGVLQYSVIHPEAVGRNSEEVLRVLEALQTGKLTPCGWHPGDDTLN